MKKACEKEGISHDEKSVKKEGITHIEKQGIPHS